MINIISSCLVTEDETSETILQKYPDLPINRWDYIGDSHEEAMMKVLYTTIHCCAKHKADNHPEGNGDKYEEYIYDMMKHAASEFKKDCVNQFNASVNQ